MRKLGKHKWWGAGLLAVAAALTIGAGTVLGGVSTPATSRLMPALPEGEPHAQPPLTGYAQTGARLSDTAIAQVAAKVAAAAGDATPGAVTGQATMAAVNSTLQAAADANPHNTVYPSSPSMAAWLESEVVVVVLHGRFVLNDAPVPPGAPAPTGTVLTLTIDSHSGFVDLRELTAAEPPGIRALGARRQLSVPAS